jgi:hypothetical protein
MPSDRSSLLALRELIADTDLTLETIPDLPQNPQLTAERISVLPWPWLMTFSSNSA